MNLGAFVEEYPLTFLITLLVFLVVGMRLRIICMKGGSEVPFEQGVLIACISMLVALAVGVLFHACHKLVSTHLGVLL